MKFWMLLPLLALAGCGQITHYQQAVKLPAPPELQGIWKTTGPQNGLVSPDAIGWLLIDASGDTLDCRQWQRVIAKPGRLAKVDGQLVNINRQLRVMSVNLTGTTLHYDKLALHKVPVASLQCQQALAAAKQDLRQDMIQNIEPESQPVR